MSKLDALRAMREAKYAHDRASGPTRREAAAGLSGTTASPAAKPSKPAAPKARADTVAFSSAEGECGHRSMNGRSCTREAGHSEKSHRYS
jgi:hypothetical protein